MDITSSLKDVSTESDLKRHSEVKDEELNVKISFNITLKNQSDDDNEIGPVKSTSQRCSEPSFTAYQSLISNQQYDVRVLERDEVKEDDRATQRALQPGRRSKSIRKKGVIFGYFSEEFLRATAFAQLMFGSSFIWCSLVGLVVTCIITAFHQGSNNLVTADEKIKEGQKLAIYGDAVKLLTTFLVFLVVFHTASAYKQWWLGRSYWGKLTCNTTHVARQAASWIRDEQLKDRLLSYLITLSYACKAVLRGNDFTDPLEEGEYLVKYNLISNKELDDFRKHKQSCDKACVNMIWILFNKCISEPNALISNDQDFVETFFEAMEEQIQSLGLCVGALNDLKETGMPVTYKTTTYFVIVISAVFSNYVTAPTYGWASPIVTAAVFLPLLVMSTIIDGMLHCFDLNLTSLPLQQFCVSIEKEIIDISNRSKHNRRLFETQRSPKNETFY